MSRAPTPRKTGTVMPAASGATLPGTIDSVAGIGSRQSVAAFSAATWLVSSMVPTFGHCSVTTSCSMLKRFSSAMKAAMLLRP